MARKKMRNLCLGTKCTTLVHQSSEATTLLHLNQNALFRGIEVAKHPLYSIRPKMMFGSVSEDFTNLWHVKRCETCVWGTKCTTLVHRSSGATTVLHLNQNPLFRGIEVAKHPFYSIGPKMTFGSVSEHFANLRHAKRCKTCVSVLNALFRGNEVAKHPFYSIRPKMMFGSGLNHFANHRT
jgi:hypothetical protein